MNDIEALARECFQEEFDEDSGFQQIKDQGWNVNLADLAVFGVVRAVH